VSGATISQIALLRYCHGRKSSNG